MSKCMLGKECEDDWSSSSKRCTIHRWTYKHDEAMMMLTIIGIVGGVCVGLVIGATYYWDTYIQPAHDKIMQLSCDDLEEYVADMDKEYDYAEHRYKWLCLDDKSIIFEGED